MKSNNPAHFLTGTITYAKEDFGKKADTYPIKYILVDVNVKKSPQGNGNNNSEKTKQDEYHEAVRDLKTQWLSKLGMYLFKYFFNCHGSYNCSLIFAAFVF